MENFLKTYGSTFEFPGLSIIDAKLNPKDSNQLVQIVKYAPPGGSLKIQTIPLEGEPTIKECHEVYGENIDKYYLRLLDGSLKIQKEIRIPLNGKMRIEFSQDGKYFVLLTTQRLYIFKIDEEIFQQIHFEED